MLFLREHLWREGVVPADPVLWALTPTQFAGFSPRKRADTNPEPPWPRNRPLWEWAGPQLGGGGRHLDISWGKGFVERERREKAHLLANTWAVCVPKVQGLALTLVGGSLSC